LRKIFIGNLNYDALEEDLHDHFAVAGEIRDVRVIRDKDSGRSRGFGFVEFESPEAAQLAVSTLDKTDMLGRSVAVSLAKEKERPPRDKGYNPYNSNR